MGEEHMRNRMISFISWIVLLLMVFCTASCKGNDQRLPSGSDSSDGTAGGTVGEIELPARDLKDMKFRILDANDHPEMHINYALESSNDAVVSALYSRDQFVMDTYHVVLDYTQINNCNKDGIAQFTNSASAGDRYYDMVVSTASGTRLSTLSAQGYFADLSEFSSISLDREWWSAQMYEQLNLGGKMYFTTGDIMASVYNAPMAVFANKSLLANKQINVDLYQTVKDGDWTVEYLTEITQDMNEDLNQDGVYHANDDFFGVACQPLKMTSSGLLIGMGYDLSYNLNNTIVANTGNMEILGNLCEQIQRLTVSIQRDKNADIIDKIFKSDRAVFLIHLIEAATNNLRDMASDYMVLPMPKGSSDQTQYRSMINGWVDCFIAIPRYTEADVTEYRDRAGYAVEAMARASYTIVRPIAFENVVMYQSVREPASLEMLNIIFNTLYLDFNCIYDFGKMCTIISDSIFNYSDLNSAISGALGEITSEAGKVSNTWLQLQ